jgi:hypothetical protein
MMTLGGLGASQVDAPVFVRGRGDACPFDAVPFSDDD